MSNKNVTESNRFLRLFILISSIPATWLFSHMTQVIWIHQECGTPERIRERAQICADNAARLQWGGLLGVILFLLLLLFFVWPFRAYGREAQSRVLQRFALSSQVLLLSGLGFWQPLTSDKMLAAVVLLFLVVLGLALRKDIAMLFRNSSEEIESDMREDQFLTILFYCALLFQVVMAFVGFFNPILDHFSWRQTQTAITTHYLVQEGFRLDYITPIFGKPWSIPMEFPLYQYLSAGLVRVTGIGEESAGRIVSLTAFYGCFLILWRLLHRLRFSPLVTRLVLTLLLFCPLYVFYARTVLIETLATMLGLISIWSAVEFFQGYGKRWLIVLLIASGLCALTKITTFVVFCFFLAGVYLFYLQTPLRKNFTFPVILRYSGVTILGVAVPLLLGITWVRYADGLKMLNPVIGDMWTSAALKTWNFGTLAQRFTFDFWQQILVSRLRDIFGHLGPLILLMLFVATFRKNRPANFWPMVGIFTFFSGPMIFATLYYVHDYYFLANGIFILLALGAKLGTVYEKASGLALRNFRILVIVPLVLSLLSWYFDKFFPKQIRREYEAVKIGQQVQKLTRENDIIVIHGDIAHPDIPYYAKRKTLINEANNRDFDSAKMQRALGMLASENLGAVLMPLTMPEKERQLLIERYAARYAFGKKPAVVLENVEVYTK